MGPRSASAYRESLRDGRRVFFRGERVEDVTTHPVFHHAVDHAALDYELAEQPGHRQLALTEEGYSRYFVIPRSADDLLRRSELIELAAREGKTLVVLIKEIGTDALFALHALAGRLGESWGGRIHSYHEHCRDGDLAVAVAQTDAKGDRALRPSEQPEPDAYLRVVEERKDGIVVRGAKVHTSVGVNANELIVLPTRAMSEADRAYAVAFATPIETPGLTLVASPYLAGADKDAREYPLSAERKMVETVTLFDDVFVPWDRVFLCGQWQLAGELARGFVEFHRFTAVSYKLPLVDALVASALLAAQVNGIERAAHVRDKLAWLVSYAETLRALPHHAAERCELVDGIAIPNTMLVNIAKLQFAQGLHTALAHVQDLAGGLLVNYAATEELDHPEHGEALRRYLAGANGADGLERLRVVLAIHAEGSIEAEKLTILAQYPREQALAYGRWLAGLGEAPTS